VAERAMQTRRVIIVIADISGYTRFTRLHRLSQAHAESIICELLEAVIAHTEHPLKLHEFLGDAACFYALSDGIPETARAVFDQVNRLCAAFRERSGELTGECRLCVCDACRAAGTLRLKVIVHEGDAVITRLRDFERVSGEDVILAHRLLKNSIPAHEYVAVTDGFLRSLGELPGQVPESRREQCEGIGEVTVAVFPASGYQAPSPAPRPLVAVRTTIRMEFYAARRILLKAPKRRPGTPSR
jgi:class 3 adenylate cyclase